LSSTIDVSVHALSSATREEAFDAIAPIDLSRIFDRWLLIPGVTGVRSQTGPWDEPGQTRTVLLSDGSEVGEELTGFDRPSRFDYRVGPLPRPLGLIASYAHGEWSFYREGEATGITWTYRFVPTPYGRFALRALIAPMWRAYARRAIAKAVVHLGGGSSHT
jgi:hypothetical protein